MKQQTIAILLTVVCVGFVHCASIQKRSYDPDSAQGSGGTQDGDGGVPSGDGGAQSGDGSAQNGSSDGDSPSGSDGSKNLLPLMKPLIFLLF